MDEGDAVKTLLGQAKKIREKSRTSCVEIQNNLYYQYLKLTGKNSGWGCGLCVRRKAETKKQFRRAFRTLTKVEQAQFYLMNVKNVERFLATAPKNQNDGRPRSQHFSEKQVIKMLFQIYDDRVYKKPTEVNAQIITKQKIIRLLDTKQQIDLHCYILRKSKSKNKKGLVLQSMQSFTPADTVRIGFSYIDFQDSYNILYRLWSEAQYQNIKKTLVQQNKFPRRSNENSQTLKGTYDFDTDFQPLTTKLSYQNMGTTQINTQIQQANKKPSSTISNSSKIQNGFVPQDLIKSLNTFSDFQQQSFGVYYSKIDQRTRKVFQLNDSATDVQKIKSAIDDVKYIRKRKDTITDLKLLNSIPTERTNLYREVNKFQNKQYQFLYFRHFFTKEGVSYFFEKSIDLQEFKNSNQTIKATINYCIWRIKKINNKYEILAEADIKYNKKVDNAQKITSFYIGQFSNYLSSQIKQQKQQLQNSFISANSDQFQNDYLSQISGDMMSQQQQFFTVTGSLESSQFPGNNNQTKNYEMSFKKSPYNNNSNQLVEQFDSQQQKKQQEQENGTTTQVSNQNGNPLKHRYLTVPQAKGKSKYLIQPKGHLVWGEAWKISESGELINMEMEKIKMQSSVLKLVVKRMGVNLIAGKGIMGVSMPIQIFGTDSILERTASGYMYAPLFLEKAAKQIDPAQRMKLVFCFALGFIISGFKMDKPFNPVLGETYQAIVDGCPIYAEQVSHHPPISSTLMYGRGYRAYGSFQSKAELGMNTASGINQGFNHIQFYSDGAIVKHTTPPGQMQGIIIGDRKLSLIKKSYHIDQKNNIFLEMHWGRNKNHRSELGKFHDFFHGKIVKLRDSFNYKDYHKVRSKDIEEQFGELYGRVTDGVYFSGNQLFKIAKDAPLFLEYYCPCLPSDSRLRPDIVNKKKGNVEAAQTKKQQIQEIQRHDQKNRKSHHRH